jgi:hypothetical protein
MVQSIEDRKRGKSPLAWHDSLGFDPPWNSLPNALVWPATVEVVDILLDYVVQNAFL